MACWLWALNTRWRPASWTSSTACRATKDDDALADDADEARGFVETDDILEGAREMVEQRAEKRIAMQRDVESVHVELRRVRWVHDVTLP